MNMANIRTLHAYIGAFIAPSILFFALTGALQLFNLHEAHEGYQPPALIEKLGRLHKDQVFALGHHRGPPAEHTARGAVPTHRPAPDEDTAAVSTVLLKWFFLAVALGLIASTLFGVWIGLTRVRGKRTTLLFLAAGTIMPIVLLFA